jgi:hypothetical protein
VRPQTGGGKSCACPTHRRRRRLQQADAVCSRCGAVHAPQPVSCAEPTEWEEHGRPAVVSKHHTCSAVLRAPCFACPHRTCPAMYARPPVPYQHCRGLQPARPTRVRVWLWWLVHARAEDSASIDSVVPGMARLATGNVHGRRAISTRPILGDGHGCSEAIAEEREERLPRCTGGRDSAWFVTPTCPRGTSDDANPCTHASCPVRAHIAPKHQRTYPQEA